MLIFILVLKEYLSSFDRGHLVMFIIDNDFTQYSRLTQHSIYLLLVKVIGLLVSAES